MAARREWRAFLWNATPSAIAKAFVRDMRAFHRAQTQLKQDEIAAGTGWMLKQHLPRGTKLRLRHSRTKLRRRHGTKRKDFNAHCRTKT